jgi:tryptophan synthase alpha chain
MTSADSAASLTLPSPITRAFRDRNARGQAALVPYICAGFPSAEATLELLFAAADAGADVLELGIPFSDPLADGPTIQKASFDALEAGMTVEGSLEILRRFRAERDTPVVLFTYLNPVYHYGVEAFVAVAREAGAQGLLLTDLPAGADPQIEAAVKDGGLDLIRLLAPTTPADRIPEVAQGGGGFLYYISRTGVTGAQQDLRADLGAEIEAIQRRVSLPVGVGFGIANPAQAAAVAAVADGVVVGSALVETLRSEGVQGAARFLQALRAGMDGATRGG